jgi:hypothetical protein
MPKPLNRAATTLGHGLRRSLFPLAALPLGVYSILLVLAGRRARATELQTGLLPRLLLPGVPEPAESRALRYGLLSLPVNVVAFALAGYVWLIPVVNLAYPLRPDVTTESLAHGTWGGPTLAGAWSVHAVGAVLIFILIGLPILNAVAWLQARLARAVLGDAPSTTAASSRT